MVYVCAGEQIIREAIHIEECAPAEAEDAFETLRGILQKTLGIGVTVAAARFGTGHRP
jgi:hypothetical protein